MPGGFIPPRPSKPAHCAYLPNNEIRNTHTLLYIFNSYISRHSGQPIERRFHPGMVNLRTSKYVAPVLHEIKSNDTPFFSPNVGVKPLVVYEVGTIKHDIVDRLDYKVKYANLRSTSERSQCPSHMKTVPHESVFDYSFEDRCAKHRLLYARATTPRIVVAAPVPASCRARLH
jgi:hypothetical protein